MRKFIAVTDLLVLLLVAFLQQVDEGEDRSDAFIWYFFLIALFERKHRKVLNDHRIGLLPP
jgi:hypothetical protein